MRYSTKTKYKKYVKGYGFLSFARKVDDKDSQRSLSRTPVITNFHYLELFDQFLELFKQF